MKKIFLNISVFFVLAGITGCALNGDHYISRRDPAPVVASTKIPEPKGEPIADSKPSDLFTRQREIKIRRKSPVNDTGSLTDLNDPRAYLFGFERPVEVGSFVDVKVVSNRSEQKSETKPGDQKSDSDAGTQKNSNGDESTNILTSLPSLEPADGSQGALVKNIKMQIMERFDNGDVLVMHRRRSIRDGQAADITVTARLPALVLARVDQLSTADLADVDWRESFNGEVAERKSANWEDEYTARLSGFEESRSKQAMAIEEKREQLKAARSSLEKEMKAFISDRDKMTKERASLLEKKSKDEEKILGLESKNSELQKQIDEAAAKESSDEDGKENDSEKSDKKTAGSTDQKTAKKDAVKNDKNSEKKSDSKKTADK